MMVLPTISYWRAKRYYYNMVGSVCRSCGREFFPPVKVCPVCGSRDIEQKLMPQMGRLITYTITRQLGSSFKRFRPITFGLVELDNGVKVLGQLVDFMDEQLREGIRVRMVIRRLREDGEDGVIFYGYKFTPDEP